jgi:hypothetical protein
VIGRGKGLSELRKNKHRQIWGGQRGRKSLYTMKKGREEMPN